MDNGREGQVEDRPWEFQHTWLEILNGTITG